MGTCFSSEPAAYAEISIEDDLAVGEIREVKFPGARGQSCVVVKSEKGTIHALSGKCTHYGANLAKGAYADGIIRCPWHGACFNVETGDIEDFPGLDSLHKYDVDVNEGKVRIQSTQSQSTTSRRAKNLTKRDSSNNQVIVIVGGGGAGQAAAETLRQDGLFSGKVILISSERNLPYDRPKLSKSLTSSGDQLALRPPGFYDDADIEVMLATRVTGLDTSAKELIIEGGSNLRFDKLILASGSTPRTLNVDGASYQNIFSLRTVENANEISSAGKGKKVVIVGTSFIGMEIAAYFADKAESVTVIGNSSVPFANSFGLEIGNFLKSLHESKGVQFILNDGVSKFLGSDDGLVSGVELRNHGEIQADVVILGIGAVPNTSFLEGSDIEMTQSGFVSVNENMETNVKDIYAAGDIASFQLPLVDQAVAIGHWQLAMRHGRCAALNAGGKDSPLQTVPFFWTQQYGKSIRYAGYNAGYDDIVFDGEVSSGEFAAYYCKGQKVVAIATLMKDPLAAQFANYISSGNILQKEDVPSGWNK